MNRVVLCELIWVRESSYGYSKQLIVDVLERVLRTKQFRLESASRVWQALTLYQESHADFAACLLSRANLQQGCTTTVTLDRKAAKTPGVERLESLAKGFSTAQTAAALTEYRSCHAHCESSSQAPGITC